MANTNILNMTSGGASQSADVIPISRSGVSKSVTAGSINSVTLPSPGYFYPNSRLRELSDPTNVDPSTSGTTNNITYYFQFYLPFNITITRWSFQTDGGTYTGAFVYHGIYDVNGNLIFDIGKIDVAAGAGQYGKNKVHDPGTNMYDSSRNATNSVTLPAGWYYHGWGAAVASGSQTIPSLCPQGASFGTNGLWVHQVNVDTVGLPSGLMRWSRSSSSDISGGHLPLVINTNSGTPNNSYLPANITFWA